MNCARRVLLLSHLFPKASDPRHGIFVQRQAERLRDAGYDLEVVSPIPYIPRFMTNIPRWRKYRHLTRSHDVNGFKVHRPPYVRPPGEWFIAYEGRTIWSCIRSTVERLADEKPFDLVYACDFVADVTAGCAAAKHLNVPCVGLAIGKDLNMNVRQRPGALRAITQSLMDCDGIVCVSEALNKRVTALTRGQRDSVAITWGIDTNIFRPVDPAERQAIRHDLGYPPDAIVILSAGYLLRDKGIYELVDAFDDVAEQYPQSMLVFLGDGAERAALEDRVARSPFTDRIRVMGHVEHEDMPMHFQAGDMLALPTYHEGMPNVVLEAMGAGLPILATHVGGIPEAVPDERYGFLVPPKDAKKLGEALERMLADESECKSMVASVRQRAMEYYDIDRLNERLRAFFEETIQKGRRQLDPPVPSLATMVDITSNTPPYTEGLARGLNRHLEVICRAGVNLPHPFWYDECGLREDLMCWAARIFTRRPHLNTWGLRRNIIRFPSYLIAWMQIICEGHQRKTRVIHIQWAKMPIVDIFMFAMLKLMGFRIVYTVHNALPHSDRRWRSIVRFRQLYRLSDALVVLSRQVGRDLEEWVLPGISHKIHVIEHGLLYPKTPSPTREEARHQLGLDENKEMLLFFGAISPYKGLDDLIRAASVAGRERPELVLFIAGGPREPWDRYQALIDECGMTGQVRAYPRFVSEAFKVTLFAATDISVLPHRDPSQSAMGCEALALGKPIIATNRGGLADLLEDGQTGYLVPAEDPPAMAKAILSFFGKSRDEQQAMAQASMQLGLDRFDWNVIADKHVALYRSLAGL